MAAVQESADAASTMTEARYYLPIVGVRYFPFAPEAPWLMDCGICQTNCAPSFPTWQQAMDAANACLAKHKANQCEHCGRTD